VNQSNGVRLFLKQFKSSDKFMREVNAYESWLSGFDAYVPRLFAVDRPQMRFLISDVGDCCSWEVLSLQQQERVQFCAGKFLRKFHEIEFEDKDEIPIGVAVLSRARAIQERFFKLRSIGALDAWGGPRGEEVTRVVSSIEEILPLLNRCKRVLCHRDFWKRNWIWQMSEKEASEAINFHVIDFEHARPDLFVFDMMKNWSDCWLSSACLESAFWNGYGRRMDDNERLLLYRCVALHALQTVLWAHEHQQKELLAQGQALITAASVL
jgi:hypothetical protein